MNYLLQTSHNPLARKPAAAKYALLLGVLLVLAPALLHAHGTLLDSRILQVRLGGPNGNTPAPWKESYYTWTQNSQNFANYAAPTFSYSTAVPNGTLSSAGINDGVQSGLNFSGLNNPSHAWLQTPVTAGSLFNMTWLATATHDPSYFLVYFTKPGFDVGTEAMGWDDLDFWGKFEIGSSTNPVSVAPGTSPVDGSPTVNYSWNLTMPTDRLGHVAAYVIWQRVDPAGEAFFATQDFNIAPASEPATAGLLALGVGSLVGSSRLRRRS